PMTRAYEEMSEEELTALTERALREHESGVARFVPQGEGAGTTGTVPISLRLAPSLLNRIKATAAARKIPYQRLIKLWPEDAVTRNDPEVVPRPATLRLTTDQAPRLSGSGTLEIRPTPFRPRMPLRPLGGLTSVSRRRRGRGRLLRW
ncbi:MAG: CopG family antitoxin, partial [Dehalococcoidia bacterium]